MRESLKGATNLYAYVGNDPLNLIDSLGFAADNSQGTSGWLSTAQSWLQGVGDTIGSALGRYGQSRIDEAQMYSDPNFQKGAAIGAAIGAAFDVGGAAAIMYGGAGLSDATLETIALNAARATADVAQSAGATSGAAGAIVTAEGVVVTDVSTGVAARTVALNPAVQEALAQQTGTQFASRFGGGCAEVGCLSQLLNAGGNPQGAVSSVVRIRAFGNPAHGSVLQACPSCGNLLSQFGTQF